jgi:hypothetical protein
MAAKTKIKFERMVPTAELRFVYESADGDFGWVTVHSMGPTKNIVDHYQVEPIDTEIFFEMEIDFYLKEFKNV